MQSMNNIGIYSIKIFLSLALLSVSEEALECMFVHGHLAAGSGARRGMWICTTVLVGSGGLPFGCSS